MSRKGIHSSHDMDCHSRLPTNNLCETFFYAKCAKCDGHIWGTNLSYEYDIGLEKECRRLSKKQLLNRNFYRYLP